MMKVSRSTPIATANPISRKGTSGSTPSTKKVAAKMMPAEVITPPVTVSPLRMPGLVPSLMDSSRTRVIKKML